MIHETIVTTAACDGRPHIAPMGARFEGDFVVLSPFRPSVTLDNIVASRAAVLNFSVNRWVTLGNGVAIAILACVGLVAQEICTERIIHVIEVVERPPRELA